MSDNLDPVDYQQAIFCQSACNLSGIVYSFAQVLPKIWKEVRAAGGGTDQVNAHPISRLYATQIHFLAGGGLGSVPHGLSWEEANKICEQRAMKPEPPPTLIVHAFMNGKAFCGFPGAPATWPPNHRWVEYWNMDVTCSDCIKMNNDLLANSRIGGGP